MSRVLERKVWETVVGYIFLVTSLLAFVFALFLPGILFQELLVWMPFQLWFWTTFFTTTPLIAYEHLLDLFLFIGAIKPQLIFGPEISYSYYSALVLVFSSVLISFGGFGFVATFGLLRTKKWRTPTSFVFSLLAWFLALYMLQSFELLTVQRSIIQFAALPFLALYVTIWVTFMSKIMQKRRKEEKSANPT